MLGDEIAPGRPFDHAQALRVRRQVEVAAQNEGLPAPGEEFHDPARLLDPLVAVALAQPVPQAVEIHHAERAAGAFDRDVLKVAGVHAEVALRHETALEV